MDEQPIEDNVEQILATPFDDYSNQSGSRWKRRLRLKSVTPVLRLASAAALIFTVMTAATILPLDALHWLKPAITWRIKSALPLIGIGTSYALLQFTLMRTWTEFLLSMAVSLGFILWGTEQFIQNPRITSLMDDIVVLLFVIDLGIIIRSKLRNH